MRYQRHLENYHLHHAKEVIEALEKVVQEEAAGQIILAGDESIVPLLREQMPRQLADRVIDTIKLDINTPEHEILDTTLELMKERDAETDAEKVARLFDEYRAGGLAVTGAADTLAALTNGQVDELLIQASTGAIQYSEKKVDKVLDQYAAGAGADIDTGEVRVVADELIRRAQATSARVTFIESTELLADVGGVGALLRYRI